MSGAHPPVRAFFSSQVDIDAWRQGLHSFDSTALHSLEAAALSTDQDACDSPALRTTIRKERRSGFTEVGATATNPSGVQLRISHAHDLTWFDLRHGLVHCSGERTEVLHSVRPCPNHHDAEGNCGDIVLELKLSIHREENFDQARCPAEQLAVLHASPTQALDRQDLMIAQLQDQVVGKILVKQYAHWPTGCRVRGQAQQSLDLA
jgi:hypothetical protein